MQLILNDENFKIIDQKNIFQEIQLFMNAVLEEHLKTNKGNVLFGMYEHTHSAQKICAELKKHA